jgi:hypothetical protein
MDSQKPTCVSRLANIIGKKDRVKVTIHETYCVCLSIFFKKMGYFLVRKNLKQQTPFETLRGELKRRSSDNRFNRATIELTYLMQFSTV